MRQYEPEFEDWDEEEDPFRRRTEVKKKKPGSRRKAKSAWDEADHLAGDFQIAITAWRDRGYETGMTKLAALAVGLREWLQAEDGHDAEAIGQMIKAFASDPDRWHRPDTAAWQIFLRADDLALVEAANDLAYAEEEREMIKHLRPVMYRLPKPVICIRCRRGILPAEQKSTSEEPAHRQCRWPGDPKRRDAGRDPEELALFEVEDDSDLWEDPEPEEKPKKRRVKRSPRS